MTNFAQLTRAAPYLSLNGRAREAIETWKKAFGAAEVMAVPEAERIRHAEVTINGGPVYVTDFIPIAHISNVSFCSGPLCQAASVDPAAGHLLPSVGSLSSHSIHQRKR